METDDVLLPKLTRIAQSSRVLVVTVARKRVEAVDTRSVDTVADTVVTGVDVCKITSDRATVR